jgi:formate/nitrite transporter
MDDFNIDAYSPAQMAERVENAGVCKTMQCTLTTLALAVLAGAFIALGAVFYTFVTQAPIISSAFTALLGGLVFCLGLILVVIAGAELFTGNNLVIMAYADHRITLKQLAINWTVVYIGNFIGALIIVFLVYFSGHWTSSGTGAKALMIANHKVNLAFHEALVRGILCNILVCLAVWLCFAGRSVTDKILAILFPITAFVALGFEHSVANMYFIPAGMLLADNPGVIAAASAPDLSQLTMSGLLLKNLLPVTLGNMIGGGVLVGLVYWFIYLRKR